MLKFCVFRRLFASVFAGAFFFRTFVSTKTNNNPKFKIMSVVLFKGNEAAKIAETFKSSHHQRPIWYTYVSNVCAYNVQYKENAPIDFKSWEDNTEKYDTIHEAIWELSGLIYNAHTNAGNYFAPMGVIEGLTEMVEKHHQTQEYKEWLYSREDEY